MKVPKIKGPKSPKRIASDLGFDAHPLALAAEAFFAQQDKVDKENNVNFKEEVDTGIISSTPLKEAIIDALPEPPEINNKAVNSDNTKQSRKRKEHKLGNVLSSITSALAPIAVSVAGEIATLSYSLLLFAYCFEVV